MRERGGREVRERGEGERRRERVCVYLGGGPYDLLPLAAPEPYQQHPEGAPAGPAEVPHHFAVQQALSGG